MGATLSNNITIYKLRHTISEISSTELQQLTKMYPNNVYFFLNDLVIDATEFVNSHPGGDSALMKRHMHDIAEDYNFHSEKGKYMILSFARWRMTGC